MLVERDDGNAETGGVGVPSLLHPLPRRLASGEQAGSFSRAFMTIDSFLPSWRRDGGASRRLRVASRVGGASCSVGR